MNRLLSAIPVVLGITIIVFLIISLIPGDPATAILGSYATPENVAKINKDLGLDKSLPLDLARQYYPRRLWTIIFLEPSCH